MASIWRHPNSKFWTACFRDGNGKQRRVSTKTSDRRLAKRIADEYEKATRHKRTLHQLEKVLRGFHEELSGESVQKRSLRAFCTEWLEEKQASVASSTAKFYSTVIRKLYAYFCARTDEPIASITRSDLVGFRAELSKHISPSAVNHDMVGVKAIFAAASSVGRIPEDPAKSIKPMREESDETPRRPFTLPELQMLLAAADPEWASMIKVGLYCGARLVDVATLKWADVNFDRSELRFVARKTRRSVLVPLAGALRVHLMALASSDDLSGYLHPRAAASVEQRGSAVTLSRQFGELLALAGLRPVKTYARRRESETRRHRFDPLSFHSLRHTFVSLLKDAGAAAATTMELSGHSSVAMSELYTHTDRASMERALASLPPL